MKLKELIAEITVLDVHADLNTEISDITNDSRAVKEGCAFVAVKGTVTDGHKYIPQAVNLGAAVIFCQEKPTVEVPYILVHDSRHALAMGAKALFRDPSSQMQVIGITGTNGKTTTTNLLKHVLQDCLQAKVGLIGTNGNMIGDEVIPTERTTPESRDLQELFRMMVDRGCTHAVMEVSSHALDQGRVDGTEFDVGVFTNLTQDHLDYHHTMENYAAAKAKLFTRCKKGIVNVDDPWSGTMMDAATCPIFTFGQHHEANLVAEHVRYMASGVSFDVRSGGQVGHVDLGIPGTFSVYNGLTVLAIAMELGIELGVACQSLSTAKGVKGRVEVVPTDGDYTILIDYAHTPDALENVLVSMRQVTEGRLVILFGCGGDRDKTKRPIMGEIAGRLADQVIVTSDNPRTEVPGEIIQDIIHGMKESTARIEVIEERPKAIAWAIEHHRPGDVIILAGKGHEDYQIIGTEKHHMDEREIVAEILEKRRNTI